MSTDSPAPSAARCWFCDQEFAAGQIARDGILRSRRARDGGPYRLLLCPTCRRENRCEKTKRGRWFASPNLQVSVVEYFFSSWLDTRPEDFLAAAAWLRDNEDRRRYAFERDGDRRYSKPWWRFWGRTQAGTAPTSRGRTDRDEPGAAGGRASRDSEHDRAERARTSDRRSGAATGDREDGAGDRSAGRRTRPRHVASPYEILGIASDASDAEIRAAFHRLARQYHPDKVFHRGEEFQRVAHAKFVELKKAYDDLIRRSD